MKKLLALSALTFCISTSALADTVVCKPTIWCNDNMACTGIPAGWMIDTKEISGRFQGPALKLDYVQWSNLYPSGIPNTVLCRYVSTESSDVYMTITGAKNYPSYFPDFGSNSGWDKTQWGNSTLKCNAPNTCLITTAYPVNPTT